MRQRDIYIAIQIEKKSRNKNTTTERTKKKKKSGHLRRKNSSCGMASIKIWSDADICHLCKRIFDKTLNRRHHCRLCGEAVCGKCSSTENAERQRYCNNCSKSKQSEPRTKSFDAITCSWSSAGGDDAIKWFVHARLSCCRGTVFVS